MSSGVLTPTTGGTPAATPDGAPYLSRKSRASRLLLISNDREQQSRRAAGVN